MNDTSPRVVAGGPRRGHLELLLLTGLASALRLLLLTAVAAPTTPAPAAPFGGRGGRAIRQREQPRLLGRRCYLLSMRWFFP